MRLHRSISAWLLALAITQSSPAIAADPLAANNGLYPEAGDWSGSFRIANMDYPSVATGPGWVPGADGGPITTDNAAAYVDRLKVFLAPTLHGMIDDAANWKPGANGWYDLVWRGGPDPDSTGGTDPNSGREAIGDTYTGQIVPAATWGSSHRPTVCYVQNHATMYYNEAAATMLAKVFAHVYAPDVGAVDFPVGSISVKAEAVTATADQWEYVTNGGIWTVFRPSVESQTPPPKKKATAPNEKDECDYSAPPPTQPLKAEVLTLRALQMSVAVKDPVASPKTGWVYVSFVYDYKAPGEKPWDRFVPLGAQWGNDPNFARCPDGRPPANPDTKIDNCPMDPATVSTGPDRRKLTETWISPNAPVFAHDTLGWGGRLAGPMDVATRHGVRTVDGVVYDSDAKNVLNRHIRASSCLSCHGSAEYPFTTNLYPSPNRAFPHDGNGTFLLYTPGSAEWARWFQDRKGNEGTTNIGDNGSIPGLDYDMAIMFALNAFNAAMGNAGVVFQNFHVH